MKILFINLSGYGDLGTKARVALSKKVEVDLLDLTDIARSFADNGIISHHNIRLFHSINDYDEIIIGAEGAKTDISNCYYEANSTFKRLLDARGLANFIKSFLEITRFDLSKIINLRFCICYSARTANTDVDHIIHCDQLDFLNSFAGNFSTYLNSLTKYQFVLIGYTGSVKFDDITGNPLGETEEQIRLNTQMKVLQKRYSAIEQEQENEIINFIDIYGDVAYSEYEQQKKYLTDRSRLGILTREKYALMNRITEMNIQWLSNRPVNYGKVIFDNHSGRISFDVRNIKGSGSDQLVDSVIQQNTMHISHQLIPLDDDSDEMIPMRQNRRCSCEII